ncbi:HAD family hydrolase [Roseibium algae]|uniref:HAD family phosphatase n=1 Tax=Roseibium algae TaxID=3123038 RepID=A0ABU8TN85_9HYPH
MTTPGLVIFDCDGVLVDTETVANRVLAEVMTDLGVPMDGPACQRTFMGRTLESVQQMAEGMCGQKLPADWPDQIRQKDLEAFAAGIKPIEGICDVIGFLKDRSIPFCVGSSGKYEKMHATLGSAGLLDVFKDVLYSAQDCATGKPAPDIFLLAARGMGADPATCVVIEDSLPGVMAARSAGMAVYGYTADPACDKQAMRNAGAVLFDKMSALPELLIS